MVYCPAYQQQQRGSMKLCVLASNMEPERTHSLAINLLMKVMINENECSTYTNLHEIPTAEVAD